jgi:hypothetical protein
MRYRTLAAACTVLAALTTVCQAAGAPDDGVAKRLFAGDAGTPHKSFACFVRKYDAAHLARHPQQKVTAMKLLITAERVPEDEHLNYSFQVGVRLRRQAEAFDSGGSCGHVKVKDGGEPQLACSVDCDGGGITVRLPEHGKSVTVELESIQLWRNKDADAESRQALEGGADDRVFRLDHASLQDCRSLMPEEEGPADVAGATQSSEGQR